MTLNDMSKYPLFQWGVETLVEHLPLMAYIQLMGIYIHGDLGKHMLKRHVLLKKKKRKKIKLFEGI